MSFFYIWRHRKKPPLWSGLWVKFYVKRAFTFPQLLKQEASRALWCLRGVKIGPLASLGASTVINPSGLTIGRGSFVGNVTLQLHNKIILGENVVINDGVLLLTGSHHIDDPLFRLKSGPIVVGDYAWIASGAIILPGVSIGKGAVIGAGAVVASDIPEYSVAVGNPARLLERRRSKELCYCPNMLRACYEAWLGKPWEV